jgi:hypothetical protein
MGDLVMIWWVDFWGTVEQHEGMVEDVSCIIRSEGAGGPEADQSLNHAMAQLLN